jgi:hypothetical protein
MMKLQSSPARATMRAITAIIATTLPEVSMPISASTVA